MFDAAFPLWAAGGVDRVHGGFEEELNLNGRSAGVEFKRTRVAARQIYVFSQAALLGWGEGAEIADHGVDFLVKHAWLGAENGWARLMSPTGEVLDATVDLYDLAFVVFGLSWHYRLTGARRTRDLALETLSFIDRRMRRGEAFAHELGASGRLYQNPHMHLLEASLAATESFGDDVSARLSDELVALFRRRFFDGATLAETFEPDWRRTSDIVEPGHQLEWAWILGNYSKRTGADVRVDVNALIAFAERYGVYAQSGLVANEARVGGAPDGGSRAWPNSERIKAHLARFELIGADPRAAIASALDALFQHHLGDVREGLWLDRFDSEGRSQSETCPASTLYHLVFAFSELLRLQPQLEKLA